MTLLANVVIKDRKEDSGDIEFGKLIFILTNALAELERKYKEAAKTLVNSKKKALSPIFEDDKDSDIDLTKIRKILALRLQEVVMFIANNLSNFMEENKPALELLLLLKKIHFFNREEFKFIQPKDNKNQELKNSLKSANEENLPANNKIVKSNRTMFFSN